MKPNMGTADRIIRLLIGAALILAPFTWGRGMGFGPGPGEALGAWHWVAIGLGLVMVVTALAARCPAYLPFGISTCRTGQA
jgi:hypothetical protein